MTFIGLNAQAMTKSFFAKVVYAVWHTDNGVLNFSTLRESFIKLPTTRRSWTNSWTRKNIGLAIV